MMSYGTLCLLLLTYLMKIKNMLKINYFTKFGHFKFLLKIIMYYLYISD